jgi:succinate dehydrogenase / fumarate reductase, iron-sulfur subunit
MAATIRLKVRRQASRNAAATWDTFEIPYQENMNVVSALMEVRKAPKTADGKDVEPPAWEAACLEEVCGSCTMSGRRARR